MAHVHNAIQHKCWKSEWYLSVLRGGYKTICIENSMYRKKFQKEYVIY